MRFAKLEDRESTIHGDLLVSTATDGDEDRDAEDGVCRSLPEFAGLNFSQDRTDRVNGFAHVAQWDFAPERVHAPLKQVFHELGLLLGHIDTSRLGIDASPDDFPKDFIPGVF